MGTTIDEPGTVEPTFGLRQHVLSPLETLAQSVSAMAPSTSAALTVPLVFALAGEGTCLAYGIAMAGIMLVALCIVTLARHSASPGSLYVYARLTLPPKWAAVTAWALCFAYVLTASSVIGGFLSFAYVFLGSFGSHVPAVGLAAVVAGVAMGIAFYDIQISTQLMLWIEGVSVCLIGFVVALTMWKHGLRVDLPQLRVRRFSASGVRLGVMLAVFSFAGFESATSLGAEARDPLRSIPRAVIWSALLCGIFFIACAYGEVVGFRGVQPGLGESTAPMRVLARGAGVGVLGPVIEAGVLVSMFAATLACLIAAARLLLMMAQQGVVSKWFARTNPRHGTPSTAGWICGLAAFLPAALLLRRGTSGADVYGYMGGLAVFGFLTAYGVVAFATMQHRRREGTLGVGTGLLAISATLAMIAALIGTVFPLPPAPYRYFPLVFATYLTAGLSWHAFSTRKGVR